MFKFNVEDNKPYEDKGLLLIEYKLDPHAVQTFAPVDFTLLHPCIALSKCIHTRISALHS